MLGNTLYSFYPQTSPFTSSCPHPSDSLIVGVHTGIHVAYSTLHLTDFDYLNAVDLVFARRYLQNIRSHPGEEKYRRIRTSNKAFQVVQHIRCVHKLCMYKYIKLPGQPGDLWDVINLISNTDTETGDYVISPVVMCTYHHLTKTPQQCRRNLASGSLQNPAVNDL